MLGSRRDSSKKRLVSPEPNESAHGVFTIDTNFNDHSGVAMKTRKKHIHGGGHQSSPPPLA
jgi:hypothetical protein